jgi:hypothetical protein
MLQGDGNYMFAEMLENLQHSTQLIPQIRSYAFQQTSGGKNRQTFSDKTRQFATRLAST